MGVCELPLLLLPLFTFGSRLGEIKIGAPLRAFMCGLDVPLASMNGPAAAAAAACERMIWLSVC